MPTEKRRVLFLCTGNSCRSQMAEGWLEYLAGDRFASLSAGARPSGYVHPMAVKVMDELDIDISRQRSKSLNEFLPPEGTPPNLIISVCNSAERECPVFPGDVERLHWPFFDPAEAEGSDDEKRAVFRRIRDEIRSAIEEYFVEEVSDGMS